MLTKLAIGFGGFLCFLAGVLVTNWLDEESGLRRDVRDSICALTLGAGFFLTASYVVSLLAR